LKKNNVTINLVDSKLDELISKLPTTTGDPAQSVSRDANNVILRAGAVVKEFKDEFVTPEHLLLAIVQGNDAAGKVVEKFRPHRKRTDSCDQRAEKGRNSYFPNAKPGVQCIE
jgi:ATP-dependent Clp protease ATP-binding subunit ClpA